MKLVLSEAIAVARRRGRAASREVRGAEEILARLADPAAGPHGLAEAGEVRRRVWRALEELPPTQRAAIVQRNYLGLSEAEMSERDESRRVPSRGTCTTRAKGFSKFLRPQSRAAGDPALPEGSPSIGAQPRTQRGGDRG